MVIHKYNSNNNEEGYMLRVNIQFIALTIAATLFSAQSIAADAEAGKKKAAMCFGCHGQNGVSNNPMYPSLAGQTAPYIENQLKAFQSGKRDNPTMKGMASGLEDKDIENLAAYFSGLPASSAGGNTDLAMQGKDKAAMCLGCHGNKAEGRGQFPRLAGQHPAYLARQLLAFQKGDRVGGPMGAMAKNLSEQDIQEISAYLGSLE